MSCQLSIPEERKHCIMCSIISHSLHVTATFVICPYHNRTGVFPPFNVCFNEFFYKIHIKRKKNTSLPNDSSFTVHHDSQGISNHFERSVFIYFTKQHKYKFSHTMFCLICPNSYYLISMENSISHEIYRRNMLKCLKSSLFRPFG